VLSSEQSVKRVKAIVPARLALDEPLAGEYEPRLVGPDEVIPAFPASMNQAGAFEDAQVPGDGWGGYAEGSGQFGHCALVVACQGDEDPAARGVGQGGEDGGRAA